MQWLVDTGERQKTVCGRHIEIWALSPGKDEAVLSAWARHFRQHYVTDHDLPVMVDGTGLSHRDYLLTLVFPDAKVTPGPSLRSGPLPAELQEYVVYAAGVSTAAKNPEAARALISRITSSAAAPVISSQGLDPVAR
jgi:hypothetical protein